MKRIIFIASILLILVLIYLNRAYAHIFSFMNEHNSPNPTQSQEYQVVNDAENSKTIKLAALGDSLTAGVGASGEAETIPYLLAKKMRDFGAVQVLNLGEPGAQTIDVLNKQISAVEKFQPDIITLFIGVNDMHNQVPLAKFSQNFNSIISQLKTKTKAKIVVVNIPYLGYGKLFLPPYQAYFDYQTKRYNQVIQKLAPGNIADVYTQTQEQFHQDQSLYSADLFHPSDKGYSLLSTYIYDRLAP